MFNPMRSGAAGCKTTIRPETLRTLRGVVRERDAIPDAVGRPCRTAAVGCTAEVALDRERQRDLSEAGVRD